MQEGREILQCRAFLSCLISWPWEKSFPKDSSRSPRQLQVSTDKAGSPSPAQNTVSGAKSNCCCWVWWLIYVILVRRRRRIRRSRSSSVTKKARGQPRLHETSSPESKNKNKHCFRSHWVSGLFVYISKTPEQLPLKSLRKADSTSTL